MRDPRFGPKDEDTVKTRVCFHFGPFSKKCTFRISRVRKQSSRSPQKSWMPSLFQWRIRKTRVFHVVPPSSSPTRQVENTKKRGERTTSGRKRTPGKVRVFNTIFTNFTFSRFRNKFEKHTFFHRSYRYRGCAQVSPQKGNGSQIPKIVLWVRDRD